MKGKLALSMLLASSAYAEEPPLLSELLAKPTMLELVSAGYEIRGTVGREPFSGQAGVTVIVFLQRESDLFICEVGLAWGIGGYTSGPWNNDNECKPLLVDDTGLSLTDGPSRYGFGKN